MDKSNQVHMDMLEKQRGRTTCPQLWQDSRYQTVQVIKNSSRPARGNQMKKLVILVSLKLFFLQCDKLTNEIASKKIKNP